MRLLDYKYAYATDMRQTHLGNKALKLFGLFRFIVNNKIVFGYNNVDPTLSSAYQFQKIIRIMHIDYTMDYIYPWDKKTIRFVAKSNYQIASVTADYNWFLKHPLKDKLIEIEKLPESDFKKALLITLNSIHILLIRISSELRDNANYRNNQLADYINNIWDRKCTSFDEAIQRILFFNALFWQNKHRQNGIGRLDYWLEPYYSNDIKKGVLSNVEQAKSYLAKMIKILGEDQKAKSNSEFPGDTGQVIIIGGADENGINVDNEITHLLLEIFQENPVPDPKLIFRSNSSTTDKTWLDIAKSIITGSGSPLILNEDLIFPLMEKFGYLKEDLYNLGTSACWEPLIIGKSFDQNNCIPNIPIVKVVEDVLKKYPNKDYNEFVSNIDSAITSTIADWNLNINFDRSSLLSLFFDDCIKKGEDFTQGGAKYNYHGILIVGLPNLINSMLNIKKYVYDDKVISLQDAINCLEQNFEGYGDYRILMQQNPLKFGITKNEVVNLTQHVFDVIECATSKRTMFGEKIKVGFSSPGYIGLAKKCKATIDGRKDGEPFAVHISPISSDIDILEVFDFASKLNYSGCNINGNVVDFFVPSAYVNNPDKFASLLKNAFKKGLYEAQLNVLDKKTLIDAKAHPENYPNLIVRVWGFSAYFNDLPEEYKDNLIQRAQLYEYN